MNFDESKQYLKNLFESRKFELIDEHSKELYFKHSQRGTEIKIDENDIRSYMDNSESIPEIKCHPYPCSISSSTFAEFLLEDSDQRSFLLSRTLFERGMHFISLEDDGPTVHIDLPSDRFISFFVRSEYFDSMFLFRQVSYVREFTSIADVFRRGRFVTAQISGLTSTTPESAAQRAALLGNRCLFTVAYMRNLPLQIAEDWPQRPLNDRPFRYVERMDPENLSIPHGRFNEDVVRLYQRGVSSRDPVVCFLSFYQVMEYYFLNVSNNELTNRLSGIISDPQFRPSKKLIPRVVNEVLKHKQETDETEMLNLVLKEFLSEEEIVEFVAKYEEHSKDSYMTKNTKLFGIDLRVDTKSGHVFGSVARRIKHIRNALVHSSDQYDGYERYVPSKKNEQNLLREVPLIRNLSERVIIGAGSREI